MTPDTTAPARGRARRPTLTSAGRGVLGMGAAAAVVSFLTGWVELRALTVACVVLLVVGLASVVGSLGTAVLLDVSPSRVSIDDPAELQVQVLTGRRRGPGRGRGTDLEIPVGSQVLRMRSLDAAVPRPLDTRRRGVFDVGPARAVREDPLRLMRRVQHWDQTVRLYVRPRTQPLRSIGSGLLRDLEGTVTTVISPSEGELHALREYAFGDDRRHVDWRATARSADGALLVRQYVEIRRSHVLLVVSADVDEYAGEDDFETGVAVAASIGVHAVEQAQQVSLFAAGLHGAPDVAALLDASCGVTFGVGEGLAAAGVAAAGAVPGATLVVLVAGARVQVETLRAAAGRWGPQVRVVAVLVDGGAEAASLGRAGSTSVLTVRTLGDLPGLLVAAVGVR